jgi:hypothetical protein
LYKLVLTALSFVFLIVPANFISTDFFRGKPVASFSQLISPERESEINYTSTNLIQSFLPEDFQNLVRNQISSIFSEMLDEVNQSYANLELGLEYDFPDGWKGILIRPANSLIVSPPEINLTNYMVNATEQGFYSIITSINLTNNDVTQEIFQTAMNSVLNEVFESLGELGPTISVSAISKDSLESFQNLSSIPPPSKSLSSVWYEYSFSVMNQMMGNLTERKNPLGTSKIQSINSSEINGIPAEISISESIHPKLDKPYRTLGYLFLTPGNIINIEYSADLDSYEKYRSQFENSIETVQISNPISINEENIRSFVGQSP